MDDKTNIVDSQYGLDFVNKLRPVEFTGKDVFEPGDENHSKMEQQELDS